MSDNQPKRLVTEFIPSKEGDISGLASANAPFIYFENAPAYGVLSGTIRVTLTASRVMPISDQEVKIDHVVVAHLRMNAVSARLLKDTLEKVLLVAAESTPNKAN